MYSKLRFFGSTVLMTLEPKVTVSVTEHLLNVFSVKYSRDPWHDDHYVSY